MKNFFIEIEDRHFILNFALNNIVFTGYESEIIVDNYANYTSNYRFLRVFLVLVRTISLLKIAKNYYKFKNRIFIIREFSNSALLIIFPLLLIFNKRIYFNINHNLNSRFDIIPYSLKILSNFGFNFILFDGSNVIKKLNSKYRKSFITPLFPIVNRGLEKKELRDICIGIVGDLRSEKIDKSSLNYFLSKVAVDGQYNIKIGTSKKEDLSIFFDCNINLHDTYLKLDYYDFLKSIDVLIIFAKSESYFYRHSGTIMDAISFGVIPICPDFPIFSSQIKNPAIVGYTYSNFDDLFFTISNLAPINFFEYKKYMYARSIKQVFSIT